MPSIADSPQNEQPQRITYSIQHVNGYFIPRRGQNEVTVDDIAAMIAGLTKTMERMKQTGETAIEIGNAQNSKLLTSILDSAHWYFDDRAMWYCYVPGVPKIATSGGSVYFMVCDECPGIIKIGSSQDVHSRTRDLHMERFKNPRLLAVCKTDHYQQLERLLHQRFWAHTKRRPSSEWFDFDIVYEWLFEQYREDALRYA